MALSGYYLGCPGWGIKTWVGQLFPPGTKDKDFLARYAEVFNTVEGNTTFYALPTAETVARWRASVSSSFRFCFKFPRTISHDRFLTDCDAEVREFLGRVAPLGETLGTLFVQLPPSFGPSALPRLRAFLDTLPREHGYGVEVRDQALLFSSELMEMLEARGIDLVNMDTRGIQATTSPALAEVRGKKPALPVIHQATATRPFVRFVPHETWAESAAHAEEWSAVLAHWLAAGKRPYFFMHAPDDTFAPENAYAFHALLRARADVGELPPWPGTPKQLALL